MKRRDPAAFAIPRFSVTRPVTVLMILLTILVVGVISYTRIPISMFPEGHQATSLNIYVSYPNASPRDVEQKITRKIEDIVGTVPNIRQVSSYSSSGTSYTRVEFHSGTNIKEAYAMLTDRMDRVKPDLPEDVDRISVRRWDQNESPIMSLVAAVPPNMDDAFYRIENFVSPALQRIEGVGNVSVWGIQSRTIEITLLDERLRSHGIDVSAMLASLRNQNVALSGGYIMEGEQKIYVRSLGRFDSAEGIADLIIDPVRRLRLRDVADVGLRVPRREWVFRVDGKPAIGIEITRESTGNIERISRNVRTTLEELATLPELNGIRFNIFSDQGQFVRQAIDNLKDTGLWGGLFAALIIYTFLRAPRMTGILTLAIPLSLLCTLVVLFFMGWSLNIATMMGLMLSVGMVIDNAIVIVENIYRRRQEGQEATAASIVGAGEVGLAVLMSTLTSVVVFLPLILMGGRGDFAFWMLRIGVPVIVALVASLFIALVFVPVAAQRLSRGHHHRELRAIEWARRRYVRTLGWVLNHRLDAAMLVAAAMLTLPIPLSKVERPRGDFGRGGGQSDNSMRFFFDLPSGGTLEDAEAFFGRFEAFIMENAEKYDFTRIETRFRYNNGRIQINFKEDPHTQWYASLWNSVLTSLELREPRKDPVKIEQEIRAAYPLPPGITMRSNQRGTSAPSGDSSLYLAFYGDDTGTLMDLAEEAARRLRTIPGIVSADTDIERGGNELRVLIDRDRARQLGVSPQEVSGTIRDSMRGAEVGRFYAPDGREMRVTAQLADADRTGLDDVRAMTFRTDSGIDVPLESVASLDVGRALGQIRRESRQTMLSVVARAPRAEASRIFQAVDTAMAGFEMPPGYRWDRGSSGRGNDSAAAMQFALILAVVFVFLLMGILFESFVLPLAVIVAVPFALLGVYWTLYLTKTPLDMMASIGVVILVGIVVNNAIVLVDLTNRLRAEGRNRLDALLEAGRHRFRPILMTTLTTVSGLIPMALGNSKMIGIPYAPLGRTIIGGLLAATVLTLVIVPLLYALLDDLRTYMKNVARSAASRPSPAATEVMAADAPPQPSE